jgi:hypothetical protein
MFTFATKGKKNEFYNDPEQTNKQHAESLISPPKKIGIVIFDEQLTRKLQRV